MQPILFGNPAAKEAVLALTSSSACWFTLATKGAASKLLSEITSMR